MKTKITVLSVLGVIATVGAAWGALVLLGLDDYAPVTRGQYEVHVAGQAGDNIDNLVRWQGIYGQQLDAKRYRAEVWRENNPGKPLPPVYRDSETSTVREIESIQMRIEIMKEK